MFVYLSPDNRLTRGGWARLSARAGRKAEVKSGAILRAVPARAFPQPGDIAIDYCRGGLVDMAADRYPQVGEAGVLPFDGLFGPWRAVRHP